MAPTLGDPEEDEDPEASDQAGSEVPSDRLLAVRKAVKSWINRLIDLSRRNNLLYFRPLKLGTVELEDVDEDLLVSLLAGEPVRLTKLLPHRNLAAEVEKDEKLVELFEEGAPNPPRAAAPRRRRKLQ